MKTLNVKRIATIAAGAAMLGIGAAAFAGPITFQNVPIVSATGQPLAQIVVGSTAQPIDAVSAGNIAAAIGNLAYASVPVTATVNQTQAKSVLKVAVTSSSYTLSNQQVWLNESGSAGAGSGTYQFGALIGSVLNGAIILSSPQSTKGYQTAAGTQYAYQNSWGSPSQPSIVVSPAASPYSTVGLVPSVTIPSATSTAGGITFSGAAFNNGGSFDNIMQITSSQLSSLLNNWGGNGESSQLWLTGFPVYDQQTGVANFQLMSAGGAYQVTFSKPIQRYTSAGGTQINVPIVLLGQNWTIINETPPTTKVTGGSSNVISGGKLRLASTVAPLTTVYVGHNITSGPWTVQLSDLGQPNSNGISTASLAIFYKGVQTNTTQATQGTTTRINVTGNNLYIAVNQTFAGLYAYQKWAKLQLYSNVYNITDGQTFNKTNDPGWIAKLLWTNTTSTSSSSANALQSIIIYNQTPATLLPGQSFTFIQNPQRYKVTFVGDQFGSANFDQITATVQPTTQVNYQNLGSPTNGITNLNETAAELTVTSQIPNAFTYAGQSSSSVTYDLTPYGLNVYGNSLYDASGNVVSTNVIFAYTGGTGFAGASSWISSTYPITLLIKGWVQSGTSFIQTQANPTITSNNVNQALTSNFYNVTSIQITNNRALAGTLSIGVNVVGVAGGANSIALAQLTNINPVALYSTAGQSYLSASTTAAGNVIYNQQNGQPTSTFSLTSTAPAGTNSVTQYDYYTINEIAVPTNTAATDQIQFGIVNATGGVTASPMFQLNYSKVAGGVGTHNNVTYTSTQGSAVLTTTQGFRTERGSKVSQISPTTDTFSIARTVDFLQIVVGLANSTVSSKSYKLYGPYGVGQATNIANVSIGPVNATPVVKSGSYNITGIGNVQAVPSVANSDTPVLLKSLSTTAPLVILDSQAAQAQQSNYILVGSGFVNSLSQQLQSSYNITFTPGSAPIYQAYGANRVLVAGFYGNQTWAAAQNFINQLYAQATV